MRLHAHEAGLAHWCVLTVLLSSVRGMALMTSSFSQVQVYKHTRVYLGEYLLEVHGDVS